jgi:hypothetical protein
MGHKVAFVFADDNAEQEEREGVWFVVHAEVESAHCVW